MSLEAIPSVAGMDAAASSAEKYTLDASPAAGAERIAAALDLQSLDTQATGGARVTASTAMGTDGLTTSLRWLGGQFAQGLEHGFYAGDVDRLMQKLVQSQDPASGVGFGDVTVELLNVQAKVGVAEAFAKLSSKLAEGLQTLVVRQG